MKIAPQWLGIVALALLFVVGMPSDSAPDPPKSLEEVARRLRVGMSIEVVCSLARAAGGRVGGSRIRSTPARPAFAMNNAKNR